MIIKSKELSLMYRLASCALAAETTRENTADILHRDTGVRIGGVDNGVYFHPGNVVSYDLVRHAVSLLLLRHTYDSTVCHFWQGGGAGSYALAEL